MARVAAVLTRTTIEEQVTAMLVAAEATDTAEDAQHCDARDDQAPAHLRGRQDRRERLRAAKAQIDAQDKAARDDYGRKVSRRAAKARTTGKRDEVGRRCTPTTALPPPQPRSRDRVAPGSNPSPT